MELCARLDSNCWEQISALQLPETEASIYLIWAVVVVKYDHHPIQMMWSALKAASALVEEYLSALEIAASQLLDRLKPRATEGAANC